MLLKDQQQIEAAAMPRLAGQRVEAVLPEPGNRVICEGRDTGKPVPWALGLPLISQGRKKGEGNLASLFLPTSKCQPVPPIRGTLQEAS